MRTRRKFNSEFKAKVAIEAIKERESISELSKRYELDPNQISAWKKEFLSNASIVFGSDLKYNNDKKEIEKQKLYQAIGQLKVENDFFKKALS